MAQAAGSRAGRISPFAKLSLFPCTVHVLTERQAVLDAIAHANRLSAMVTCWEIDYVCSTAKRCSDPDALDSYDSLRFIKCVLKVEVARLVPSLWKRYTPSHMKRARLWFWSSVVKRRKLLPDAPTNLCEACSNLATGSWTSHPSNAIETWFDDSDSMDEAFADAVGAVFHAEGRYLMARQTYAERYVAVRGTTRASAMASARRIGGGLPTNPYKHLRWLARSN